MGLVKLKRDGKMLNMDITWLGHSAFRLKGKQGVMVIDPFDPKKVGIAWSKQKADIVTVSHQHEDHNYLDGVGETDTRKEFGVFVIKGPGEYEAGGMFVQGWATFHDQTSGSERGKNTVYLIEVDRIRVLHLGDLGHQLSEKLIEEIGQVDVLLVPVGGVYTIGHEQAAKVVRAISPSYAIPMHYQINETTPALANKLEGLQEFLQEFGVSPEPMEKLTVTEGSLPEDTQIVVLKI